MTTHVLFDPGAFAIFRRIMTGNHERSDAIRAFPGHSAMLEFQYQIHQKTLGMAVVGEKAKPLTGGKLGITHKPQVI